MRNDLKFQITHEPYKKNYNSIYTYFSQYWLKILKIRLEYIWHDHDTSINNQRQNINITVKYFQIKYSLKNEKSDVAMIQQ